MSGEILLEERSWKNTVPATLLSFAAAAAVMLVAMRRLSMSGWQNAVMGAILAYILYRVLYPAISSALPKSGRRTLTWEVTRDVLVLDGEIISRGTIHRVHCWPNRDALGHAVPGYTVNIEMQRGNELLCSVTRGEEAEASAAQLRALVEALGGAWPGE